MLIVVGRGRGHKVQIRSKLDFVSSVMYRANGSFFDFLKHAIKPQPEDCSFYAFIKYFIQTSSCKSLNKLFSLLMAKMQIV